MRKVLVGSVLLFALGAWAQQISRVEGCLAMQGNQFVLTQANHGKYELQGKQDELKRHLGEQVRISGRVYRGKNGPGGLRVTSVDKLQPDCTAMTASGATPDAITGKTGMEGTAIPTTSTATAGQVTPGAQTEEGVAQQPGKHSQAKTAPPPPSRDQGPGAPPDWEKAGQSPGSANTMAEAAARAEVKSGALMGTKAAAPQSAGEKPQVPRTEAATQQDRTVRIRDGGCLPEKLTIRPGEAVQWINNSRDTIHVASPGMQTATGGNGSGAFSSDVGAGKTFRQVFDKEGTYHYSCGENGKGKPAEIEVREE